MCLPDENSIEMINKSMGQIFQTMIYLNSSIVEELNPINLPINENVQGVGDFPVVHN